MFGWIGANSNGNLTTGIGFRMGPSGKGPQTGCLAQGLACIGIVLWLAAIIGLIWLLAYILEILVHG